MRLWQLILVFTLVMALPFFIWGEALENYLSYATLSEWMGRQRAWAAVIGVTLLIVDLILPIPGTVVMSALGYTFGAWWGGLISVIGSMLAGCLGYMICYRYGWRAAQRFCQADDLRAAEVLFNRHGLSVIALSRWLPLLPEVMACWAGVHRLSPQIFITGLTLGTVPMAFTYAAIGASGKNHPTLALSLSALIPLALIAGHLLWKRKKKPVTSPH